MIKLILSKNITGYYAQALFEWCNNAETEAVYLDKMDWSNLGSYLSPDDDEVYVVGLPYFKSYSFPESALKSTVLFRHMASFGDEIVSDNPLVISTVSLVDSPLVVFKDFMELDLMTWNRALLTDVVYSLNAYHTYTFDDTHDRTPINLMLLGNLYKEQLHIYHNEHPSNIHRLVSIAFNTIMALRKNMEDYIQRKIHQSRMTTVTYGGKYCNVMLIYAEEHANEIAHRVMTTHVALGIDHLVVLVGSHTQTNDRLAVRTTADIDASLVAKAINGGKGKPQTASVFLSDTPSANFNVITSQLETAMSRGVL